MSRKRNRSASPAGGISRRDFVNGVLVGSGAALLSAPAFALRAVGDRPLQPVRFALDRLRWRRRLRLVERQHRSGPRCRPWHPRPPLSGGEGCAGRRDGGPDHRRQWSCGNNGVLRNQQAAQARADLCRTRKAIRCSAARRSRTSSTSLASDSSAHRAPTAHWWLPAPRLAAPAVVAIRPTASTTVNSPA